MVSTRVEKYKNYRNTLLTSNDKVLNSKSSSSSQTGTLPIKEVYTALDQDEEKENDLLAFKKRQAKIRNIFIIIGLALVAIGLVIFAIFAFKGN